MDIQGLVDRLQEIGVSENLSAQERKRQQEWINQLGKQYESATFRTKLACSQRSAQDFYLPAPSVYQ